MTPPVWVTRLCHRYPQRSICTPLILTVAAIQLHWTCIQKSPNKKNQDPAVQKFLFHFRIMGKNSYYGKWLQNLCKPSPPMNFYVWTYKEVIYRQDPNIIKLPLVTCSSAGLHSHTTTAAVRHPNNIGSTFKRSKYRPLATTTLTIQFCTQEFRWLYTVVKSLWARKPLRGTDAHKKNKTCWTPTSIKLHS